MINNRFLLNNFVKVRYILRDITIISPDFPLQIADFPQDGQVKLGRYLHHQTSINAKNKFLFRFSSGSHCMHV